MDNIPKLFSSVYLILDNSLRMNNVLILEFKQDKYLQILNLKPQMIKILLLYNILSIFRIKSDLAKTNLHTKRKHTKHEFVIPYQFVLYNSRDNSTPIAILQKFPTFVSAGIPNQDGGVRNGTKSLINTISMMLYSFIFFYAFC